MIYTNPIIEYHQLIESGKLVTSHKVKIQYRYIVWLINNSKEYVYDEKKANKAIDFIETFCKHSKGSQAGKPFILELWQKAFVASIFGIVHVKTGKRKFKRATLIVARKNGKSTLAAAIGLYMFIMDGEMGAEVYSVATKKDQAKIIWKEAKRMISKSPVLKRYTKSLVSQIDFKDSVYMPVGRDSDTLDGLNVHCATLDEVHAWKDQNLYDVIVDGTSSRDNWLILVTSTAGTVRENVFDGLYSEGRLHIQNIEECYNDDFKEYDPELLFVCYELDSQNEWRNEVNWIKANPGVGTIKKVSNLRTKVNKALLDDSKVKNLLTKDFNVPDTASDIWFSLSEIVNDKRYVLASEEPDNPNALYVRYGIGGFDLSVSVDLTCASVLFRVPDDPHIYVKQMYWIPEEILERRVVEDKVPYDKWHQQGLLRLCDGNKINHHDVLEWFVEIQEKYDIYIYKIGYDRYGASFLVNELKSKFGENTLVDVAQGVKTLSSPMYSITADFKSKLIVYNDHPILKWCMTNVAVKEDTNGNIQPQKTQNPRRRIDGFASLLDAYVVYEDEMEYYLSII